MKPPAVTARGLVKRYGAVTAADGLTFTAAAGQVTALLGPNGAGKTTTTEICEGFRRPDAGKVEVLGLDPVRQAAALRPRVGVMPQGGGVPTAARAGEWLRLMARFYANPVDPALLIERLGLGAVQRLPYKRLSGGQQQRLSLAAAVIGRPELVFLDEPTAGLDPQARHATWELIEELREAGAGVLLTTHYMEEAERLADHVVIIDHGKVVAQGTTADLTGARDELRFRARGGLDLDELLAALPVGCVAKEQPTGHYVIEAAAAEGGVGPGLLATVTAWCASNGILAEDLRVERRTLEDIFLELTGRGLRS